MRCACGNSTGTTNWARCSPRVVSTLPNSRRWASTSRASMRPAAPVVAASTFGTASALRKVILDNFASLRSLPEAAQWQQTVRALEQWVEVTHDRLATLIGARRDSGLVRECHGDLHCGNVVRWEGSLTPFDGIEFDPALRFIDVANDIAFLTMDLAMHDRHGPAARRAAGLDRRRWATSADCRCCRTSRRTGRSFAPRWRRCARLQEQSGSQREKPGVRHCGAIPRLGQRSSAAPPRHASC